MQIQREDIHQHSIRSYSQQQIIIGEQSFAQSLIVNAEKIIHPWSIHALHELTEEALDVFVQLQAEIVLIGTEETRFPPPSLSVFLAQKGIGFECMRLGSACRSFNILLSEHRRVALGIILG